MKNMTVEELLCDFGYHFGGETSDNLKFELLRRFEELSDIGVERDNMLVAYENLKCCGNCKLQSDKSCPNYDWDYSNPVHPEGYCSQWQSDKLTRKDRDRIDG